jgi:succinate dehydrogenase flavin-adding protein (antitoxin of CptAB toxin-antitoxin module)
MPTVHSRALKRAAEICGEQELAVVLGVSDRELQYWIQGSAVPPERVFLQVVDMLSEYALQEIKNQQFTSPKG